MKRVLSESALFPAFFRGTATEARSAAGTPSAIQAACRMWALHAKKQRNRRDHNQRHPKQPQLVMLECYEQRTPKKQETDGNGEYSGERIWSSEAKAASYCPSSKPPSTRPASCFVTFRSPTRGSGTLGSVLSMVAVEFAFKLRSTLPPRSITRRGVGDVRGATLMIERMTRDV